MLFFANAYFKIEKIFHQDEGLNLYRIQLTKMDFTSFMIF